MKTLEKISVLIDADNTQLAKIELALQEISTHGRIVVKRAYGNWTKNGLKNWETEVNRLAIKSVQQFDYVVGKNATDMALVIDAMELLTSDVYDAFAIVSSDSDYTPLAIKLRESGVYVFGVGTKNTPQSFRNSCDEFIYLENLIKEIDLPIDVKVTENLTATANMGAVKAAQAVDASSDTDITIIHALLKKAFDTYQDEDGYALLSNAGLFIKRAKPDFDARTFGFSKLTQLIEAFPKLYDTDKKKNRSVLIVKYRCK